MVGLFRDGLFVNEDDLFLDLPVTCANFLFSKRRAAINLFAVLSASKNLVFSSFVFLIIFQKPSILTIAMGSFFLSIFSTDC